MTNQPSGLPAATPAHPAASETTARDHTRQSAGPSPERSYTRRTTHDSRRRKQQRGMVGALRPARWRVHACVRRPRPWTDREAEQGQQRTDQRERAHPWGHLAEAADPADDAVRAYPRDRDRRRDFVRTRPARSRFRTHPASQASACDPALVSTPSSSYASATEIAIRAVECAPLESPWRPTQRYARS
jgi:hypothetical protein